VSIATVLTADWRLTFRARLRAARLARGLSLQGIEVKSGGAWKAVVIGSYERGDRMPSMERLTAYAKWLGVPTSSLVPDLNPWWDLALGGAR
jgi:transcriptional regulator with XRE-family HTH domain